MNHSFSKTALFATCVLFFASSISAQVNEPELKSVSDTVEFINYVGPHAKIDSLSAIKEIGAGLGRVVARSRNAYITAGERNRYYIVHAVDPNEKGKLDADILYIGRDATVDHIVNVRRIISAYLVAAYNYSERDADTLAVFITVYNAVYRGNISAFQRKYKDIVIRNLTAASCGMSVRYSEWPGNTQIVIPLYNVDGGLSTVDTSTISDKDVVQAMQEDDDKNIDSRKEMVDIKEREADNASAQAQDAQRRATEEARKAEEERRKDEEAQRKAEEARERAEENPNDRNAQREADEAERAAEEQRRRAEEQEQRAQDARDEAKEAQEFADRKETEAQRERDEIAKDQQTVLDRTTANARADAVYGMQLTDENELLSGLVKVNATTGEVIHASPVTFIRDRTFYPAGDSFIAIAGQNVGNGIVKLVLLDSTNMEITKESNEIVSEDSVLVRDGQDYYCIIQDGSNYVLGKYDETLKLLVKSPVPLMASSPVSVSDKAIVVTGSNGRIKLLNKSDLTEMQSTTARTAADAK
ncbi:MAG: hypothetical protein J6I73_09410 [Treponema sp.]|nr:hypothetical protein [Treponema sp.]